MDGNYFYAALSFLVGLASGFQGIYDRYQKDAPRAARTRAGFAYLLTRGAIPALVFVILYNAQLVKDYLWAQSLAYGTGIEVILRTKIYVKEVQKEGGGIEEVLRGPFDLLRWYQNFLLEYMAGDLAEFRRKIVESSLPAGTSFLILCNRVLNNLDAWPDPQIRVGVTTAVDELKDAFNKEQASGIKPGDLNRKYQLKLGYAIINRVGQGGLTVLLPPN